jgi:hypothetical protein
MCGVKAMAETVRHVKKEIRLAQAAGSLACAVMPVPTQIVDVMGLGS